MADDGASVAIRSMKCDCFNLKPAVPINRNFTYKLLFTEKLAESETDAGAQVRDEDILGETEGQHGRKRRTRRSRLANDDDYLYTPVAEDSDAGEDHLEIAEEQHGRKRRKTQRVDDEDYVPPVADPAEDAELESDDTSSVGETFQNDQSSESTDELEPAAGELQEKEILRDSSNRNIYVKRVLKSRVKKTGQHGQKKTGDRVYNARHACVYCGQFLAHIRVHLRCKHAKEDGVKRILKISDQNKADVMFDRLRAAGDDKHNCSVIAAGAGELLLARRPTTKFISKDYSPCPKCREWMKTTTLIKHQRNCKSGQGIAVLVQVVPVESHVVIYSSFRLHVLHVHVIYYYYYYYYYYCYSCYYTTTSNTGSSSSM